MRPPSYYASIVKSNTSAYGPNSNYNLTSSSSNDNYLTPRTSSQQLRSSLSNVSSSNYVNRSHLPFVAQSTLVAHCITGAGSSTRPYGSSSSSSTSNYHHSSSSYRTSRRTSPAYSLSTNYTSTTSSTTANSRPNSTNRRLITGHVSLPATSNKYSCPSSSAIISSRAYARPIPAVAITPTPTPKPTTTTTTTSSYYKPTRLRERPLLTQISRHLPTTRAYNYTTPRNTSTSTRDHSNSSGLHLDNKSDRVSEKEDRKFDIDKDTLGLPDNDKFKTQHLNDESNWSSDITRNISRNKYLIKFREFDKHSRPSVDVEATIQLPPIEPNNSSCDTSHDRNSCVPDRDTDLPSQKLKVNLIDEQRTMRLPISETTPPPPALVASDRDELTRENESQVICDVISGQSINSGQPKLTEPKRERKNVKLKLKPIGGLTKGDKKKRSELVGAEATITTTTTTTTTTPAENLSRLGKPDVSRGNFKKVSHVDTKANNNNNNNNNKLIGVSEGLEVNILLQCKDLTLNNEKVVADKRMLEGANVTGDVKILEIEIADDEENKENKIVASKVRLDAKPVTITTDDCTDVAITVLAQPPAVAKPKVKVKKGSIIGDGEQGVIVGKLVESKKQESKTRLIIKKKKKTKQEDAGVLPTSSSLNTTTARRRSSLSSSSSSAVPKELALQINEIQATASSSANLPSTPSKQPSRIRFREYNIEDFNFLTVLGHGGWGFVILAELKQHDACFAVKCIKKITIVEDDDYDSIIIERKMLTLGNIHPFICKLFCTFETPGYLFFVMEYCPGGDLMFHVQHEGKFTESRCRFYACEIICAIRFLHNRHIIYRDLKLDNILLDAKGHIRLVDFGMCQCRTYREEMLPSNFCGTPEYISPEIIKGVPYNHSVDWWSFGVLLYEMAVGKMPFRGNDENELLWNVCYEQIHYPMFLTKELTTLLKSLLEREPTKRMGMATCKAGDIYDQPFFRSVDWKAVEELRVEPPFVPEVRSNRDVSNFDSDFTESTCELSPIDESTLARIDQKQFEKFPYTNPDLFIFDPTQQQQPDVDHPKNKAIS